MSHDPYAPLRNLMVQIVAAHAEATKQVTGLASINQRVLDAMEAVPRHEFVPVEVRAYAHADGPLPIGWDKTISQPFITALMTELLCLDAGLDVLEIGTGLGYHTALLSGLARRVYTVEIVEELAEEAARRLASVGCENIFRKVGNGYNGWPEHAPYDRIVVAAAPELIPPSLIGQLKPGGRMVLPAGLGEAQQLMVVDKSADGKLTTREILAVRFSPMEGTETAGQV
ncbi:MAG: protein-L-isoaspartate(D-aspartate) O-methyltransferase [Rhodospirillales bacterium]|jgi:protein-L-isoaspartate(D-aspartate) O-methyltransferase|nr:protein-L-isoaspartate(D-aspartate) O-methyltransferase [Rhodospirillales bacterium]MDP6643388.1 protein-L-isoaspartate(D-aspartate) O-methyltransferase [Rhodospirillales bacterium]MDP6840636.1 protein-L-isoaspartate(D-aspartate) O-methyltransferase [Rhodospirillales bacterium]